MKARAPRRSFGLATATAIAALSAIGCASGDAPPSPPRLGTVRQADSPTPGYETAVKDACAGRSTRFVGRVTRDLPDVYSIAVSKGDVIEIRVRGVYGFDPFIVFTRGRDVKNGFFFVATNDDAGVDVSAPPPRTRIATFDSHFKTTAVETGTQYIIVTGSDAQAQILHGARRQLPLALALWSYLGGAPELYRSTYVAQVSVNGTAMATAPRGCTAERSPTKPLPLVPADPSQAADDETTCRDECIGDAIKPCTGSTACKPEPCPLNYKYCCTLTPTKCVLAYACFGGYKLGGCDCCYAFDPSSPFTCIDCRTSDYVFEDYCPKT